jgi:hypothetical protein
MKGFYFAWQIFAISIVFAFHNSQIIMKTALDVDGVIPLNKFSGGFIYYNLNIIVKIDKTTHVNMSSDVVYQFLS